jgi:transcriptional regulator with XRE-family HTH domain
MPTRPTTPQQKEDARRLKALYERWVQRGADIGVRRTQEDVADALGTSQSTVTQTLTGKLALNAKRAAKFAKLFDCTVADFSADLAREIASISQDAPPQSESRPQVQPSGSLTPGAVVEEFARRMAALPVARRRTIAHLVAERVVGDSDGDIAVQIDALAPGVKIALKTAPAAPHDPWRDLAFRLAEAHPDPTERDRLTQFIRQVDLFVTASQPVNSVTPEKTREEAAAGYSS